MRRFFTLLILIAALVATYVWLTPYLTLQKLVAGMENEDPAIVERYVDFDRVKTSFQNDFVTSLGLEDGAQSNMMDSIGTTLATRIAGTFINNIVSPETMVSVLKDKDRRERLGLSRELMTLLNRGEWVNGNQFVLHDDFGKPTMLLERTGAKWEVTAISLK